jgi:predicted RNase H-like HicB family nuclease
MENYSYRVFWSDQDTAYVAVCPEFPRLSGIGKTAESALTELRDVLQEALEVYREEGWPLPALAKDAGYSGQFRVRVPRSLHAALAARADVEGVSMNLLVTQYLAHGLGHDPALPQAEREYRDLPAVGR